MLSSHMHFSHMRSLPLSLRTAAAVCFALSGCSDVDQKPGGERLGSGDWQLHKVVDPMSESEGIAAQSAIRTQQGMANVQISCFGGKQLSYEIAFQSESGEPAIIAWPAVSDPTLQASFDGEDAIAVGVKQPRPMNTLLLQDANVGSTLKSAGRIGRAYWGNLDGSLSRFTVMRFSLANELRLKVALMSGDAVVAIDQTAPAIRSVLDRCRVDRSIIDQAAKEQAAADQKRMDDYRNFQASEYGPAPEADAQEVGPPTHPDLNESDVGR
jgi:hypothetical protein